MSDPRQLAADAIRAAELAKGSALRTPRDDVGLVPADLAAPVPDPVRQASADFDQARQRYFELADEHADANELLAIARAEDEQAVREAVAQGGALPKPKTQEALERAATVERQLEPVRQLAIEAENHYLNTCREHRAGWLAAIAEAQQAQHTRVGRALTKLETEIASAIQLEHVRSEIDQLGDPATMRRPDKHNQYAIFQIDRRIDLDKQDRQKLRDLADRYSPPPQPTADNIRGAKADRLKAAA